MLRPDSHPGPARQLSRRRVLVDGGRSLLALGALGGAVTACGSGQPPEPDPLEAELQAARSDADLAAAAAKAAPPPLKPALSVIADERARHATVLVEELSRAAGKPTPTSPTSTSPAAAPPKPAPTVRDVAAALRRSADSATKLAPTLSGYRAGLMGSIAAACTTFYTVGLPHENGPK